jgi:imidazoleglycerol-phosphate dehydratase
MSDKPRETRHYRGTKETTIDVTLKLDGTGQVQAVTGIGFFDHMLTAFGFNALFDIALTCEGDLEIDQHHTVEDVGIALGEALKTALGDYKGIVRYGDALVPMDESLVQCALDLSGRAYVHCDIPWKAEVGMEAFDFALVNEFHWGFARAASMTTNIRTLCPGNNHHMCEASFKAFGRALCAAVAVDPRRAGQLPSTKGSL